MHVKGLLKQKGTTVTTTSPDQTIQATAELLHRNRIGAVIVSDSPGGIAGILSERDIIRGMALYGSNLPAMQVRDLMSTTVRSCSPDDTLEHLMDVMTTLRIRHLPVVDPAGRLCGMVSIGDVVKETLAEIKEEAESLRSYVMTAG